MAVMAISGLEGCCAGGRGHVGRSVPKSGTEIGEKWKRMQMSLVESEKIESVMLNS